VVPPLLLLRCYLALYSHAMGEGEMVARVLGND
jgi:hypothetical protein